MYEYVAIKLARVRYLGRMQEDDKGSKNMVLTLELLPCSTDTSKRD